MNYTIEMLLQIGVTAEQAEKLVAELAPKMQVITLTEDEIRQQGRSYNAQEWDRIIDRFTRYSAVFYKRINSPNEYDEYFAQYTTSDGIRIFNSVSYSSSLTARGMVELTIDEEGNVRTREVYGGNGHYGRIDKSDMNSRNYMAKMSKRGLIYTDIL